MSAHFADDCIPRIAPLFRLQWEEAQQAYVILYPEGMVKLNKTAGEILTRCDGKTRLSAIIEDLEGQFSGAKIGDEVRHFMETAHEQGWVRISGAP